MKPNETVIKLHLENLIHEGQVHEALKLIQETEQRTSSDTSTEFILSIRQLSHLCQLHLKTSDPHQIGPEIMISDIIIRAVQLGLLDVADMLTGDADVHHYCILIEALYSEGYISIVKEKIAQLYQGLLLSPQAPYCTIAFIHAEILHDEEQYTEAATIFEALAEHTHYMAKARFAACSCYLHETMNFLWGRIELYHPSKDELEKIEKYIDDIAETLQIINTTNWHTVWSLSQNRRNHSTLSNFPLH